MKINNKNRDGRIFAAGILLALLVNFCPAPRVFADETAEISLSGRETIQLNDKGDYVEITYGSEPEGGVVAYRERDTSPETREQAVEESTDEALEEEDEKTPWWKSRAAKIIYACVGAVALVAALWHIVASVRKKRAWKAAVAAEETVTAAAFIPPPIVLPQTVRAEPAQPGKPPEKAEIKLTTVAPTDAKQYVARITDKIEIGRGEQCQVLIQDDTSVSLRHCEILWNEGSLCLRDLNSSNGTGVNGVPISGPHNLKPGDVIELGRVRLRLSDVKML